MIRKCCRLMAVALALGELGACSLIQTPRHPKNPDSPASSPPRPSPPSASFWPPWKLLHRKRITPPPKAAPLMEVGTVRSVSGDGSYAIVELSPGTLVRTGDALIVTSKNHPVSRLKVAEVQTPCFAAEVEEGSVCPGDVAKR